VLEREPLKDFRVGLSMETRLLPGASADDTIKLGFKVSVGGSPPFQPPLSPATMSREIFGAV